MIIAPKLCEQCRRENRIATVNGPTCPHQASTGAAWFPAWWGDAVSEARRAAWLVANTKEVSHGR